VFERFARLQAGRERDAGGVGLGLALTKRVVEQHGGRISVEDSQLGGAAFVVALPSTAWTMGADPGAWTDADDATHDDADADPDAVADAVVDADVDADVGAPVGGSPTGAAQDVPATTGT
jgi:hypothetical protein